MGHQWCTQHRTHYQVKLTITYARTRTTSTPPPNFPPSRSRWRPRSARRRLNVALISRNRPLHYPTNLVKTRNHQQHDRPQIDAHGTQGISARALLVHNENLRRRHYPGAARECVYSAATIREFMCFALSRTRLFASSLAVCAGLLIYSDVSLRKLRARTLSPGPPQTPSLPLSPFLARFLFRRAAPTIPAAAPRFLVVTRPRGNGTDEIRETSLPKVAQHFAVHRPPQVKIIWDESDRIFRLNV